MSFHLLMNDELSDVTLKVSHAGYTWRFPAHATLLSSKSCKFKEMLEERMDGDNKFTVNVIGTQPDTMLQILRYMYSNEYPTEVTADNLSAARKFHLRDLENHLEELAVQNLTIDQACNLLENLETYGSILDDCIVKFACMSVIEKHAYIVFSSDFVLGFSRKVLLKVLESCELNVPDESVLFWGVWRWGKRYSSQNTRFLTDERLIEVLADMLACIRQSSVRQLEGIPQKAICKFNSCLPRRCRYRVPEDSLSFCTTWQPSGSWEILTEPSAGETRALCLQVSFDKKVILMGITFEICVPDLEKAYLLVFRELDRKELLRQEINCFQCSFRKLSRTSASESWLKAEVLLSEPLILSGVQIYSVYLQTRGKPCSLPRALPPQHKKRIANVFATVHGQDVAAVKELHLMPDVKCTWE
ncbi:hypothetical protein CEXT_56991 [Caerostris extrusa]|uniref:BTB domain-containing protein n=1 Tax=Caerostris extrusa TaxID=172846 RepID=A0AAV4RE19_CAEEX|nr:hypothetical protein CEXT_56991 [Caerostris extrusa]